MDSEAMSGEAGFQGGHARASDRDRHRVAEELRIHCADGRLDVEEFEQRLEQAMSPSRTHELVELVSDLPSLTIPDQIDDEAGAVRLGPPGARPFTRRIEVPAPIDRVRRIVLDTLAALNSSGVELIYQDPTTLTFQRSSRPRVGQGFR